MQRIHHLLGLKSYWENIQKIEECEKDRIFCKHDMNHFMDVARIGYIYILENELPYSKELIYAVGLLHDIGKWMQYEQDIPHEKASWQIAKPMLLEVDFSPEECKTIHSAIKHHRKYEKEDNSLCYVTWYADKKSRKCFCCPSEKDCNWSNEKKNWSIHL